jgi:hypothetical protein
MGGGIQWSTKTFFTDLHHVVVFGPRAVEQDIVAGHANNPLDAALVRLDGDGVGDAVADAHAAAPAVRAVGHEPLVPDQEGRQHRGPGPGRHRVPVLPEHVGQREGLARSEEYADRVA